MDGGAGGGGERVEYGDARRGIRLDLPAKTVTGPATGTDTIVGIRAISGTPYDDVMIGGRSGNCLFSGNSGDDRLRGGCDLYGDFSDDTLIGGPYLSRIVVGDGNDVLRGRAWLAYYYGGNGDDVEDPHRHEPRVQIRDQLTGDDHRGSEPTGLRRRQRATLLMLLLVEAGCLAGSGLTADLACPRRAPQR